MNHQECEHAVQSTSSPRNAHDARTAQPKTRPVPQYSLTRVAPKHDRPGGLLSAERRGFEPGYEAEDWLAAESEVDAALMLGALP